MADRVFASPFAPEFAAMIDAGESSTYQNGLDAAQLDYINSGFHTAAMDACLDPSLNADDAALPSPPGVYARRRYSRALPQGSPPSNLPILSAETHDDAGVVELDRSKAGKPNADTVLGVMLGQDDEPQEARTRSPPTPRASAGKKSRTGSYGSEEDNAIKRSRGRPRLDTRDENASDRRRTQIRLAQRAYRMRKETTISSLKKRVTELESSVDEMNRSFLDFNDDAIRSGIVQLRPALAKKLKETTQRFLSLAQISSGGSDNDTEECGEVRHAEEQPQPRPTHSKRTRNGSGPPTAPAKGRNSARSCFDMPYPVFTQRTDDPPERMETSSADAHQDIIPSHYQQFRAVVPDVDQWAQSLTFPGQDLGAPQPALRAPVSTYAHEPTFGRRLLRAALEAAYRLLVDPLASAARRDKVFRFCFARGDTEKMIARTTQLLLRMNNDSEKKPWALPRPRRACGETSPNGYSVDGLDASMVRGLSDGVLSTIESCSDGTTAKDMTIESEWLDADGVEEYLRGKGVRLDTAVLTEEVEVEVADPISPDMDLPPSPLAFGFGSAGGVASVSGGSRNSPTTPDEGALPDASLIEDFSQTPDFDVSLGDWNFGAAELDDFLAGYRSASHPVKSPLAVASKEAPEYRADDAGEPLGYFGSGSGVQPTKKRKRARTIDVSKLLRALLDRGVCVGRAPGFHKADVDMAVKLAMRAVW
ncbi:MAG: hypothetical protein M1832_005249 [Thelocarpon impressellum]|nr:MAG: hypothetical protein M1832_005249 [Thelocarpon impressellum]